MKSWSDAGDGLLVVVMPVGSEDEHHDLGVMDFVHQPVLYKSKYEIPFLTACIQAFGSRFAMTRQAAFRYLHEYKGLAFLIDFYDVEHLQSLDETIDDLLIVCQKNGGILA